MRAIIKVPGRDPALIDIDNTLHRLQMIVDGYIETHTIAEDVAIICNEEGKLRGLPYNCTICGEDFVGTILFVGVGEEDFTDVPESLIRMIAEGHFKEVSALNTTSYTPVKDVWAELMAGGKVLAINLDERSFTDLQDSTVASVVEVLKDDNTLFYKQI